MLESESESDFDSPTRRSGKDSATYSIIHMNSSFTWDEGMRCATRWPTVFVALRSPNWSAAEALRMRYFRESGSPPASYVMMLANEKVRWPGPPGAVRVP